MTVSRSDVRFARTSCTTPISALATRMIPNSPSRAGPRTRMTASNPPRIALNRVRTFARMICPTVRPWRSDGRLPSPASMHAAASADVRPIKTRVCRSDAGRSAGESSNGSPVTVRAPIVMRLRGCPMAGHVPDLQKRELHSTVPLRVGPVGSSAGGPGRGGLSGGEVGIGRGALLGMVSSLARRRGGASSSDGYRCTACRAFVRGEDESHGFAAVVARAHHGSLPFDRCEKVGHVL